MAESLISRVYEITVSGYDESLKRLTALTEAFKAMDEMKQKLNGALQQKMEMGDTAEVERLKKALKDLSEQMQLLTASGNNVTKELKNQLAANTEVQKTWAQLRAEYKAAEANTREMAARFGAQSKEALEAAEKLSLLKAQLKDINDLVKKGPTKPVAVFQTNLADLEREKNLIQETGDVVNEVDRKQAQAVIAAIEWGKAQKGAATSTKESNAAAAETLEGLEKYTGTLRGNMLALEENKKALAENKLEQKLIAQNIEQSGIATTDQADRLAYLQEQAVLLQTTNRDLNTVIRNQIKEYSAASGSIEQLQAQVNQLQKAYSQLSESERDSTFGRELKSQLDQLEPKLKELEGSMGRFQRNVGNYPAVVLGAFKDLGLSDMLKQESDKIKEQLKRLTEESKQLAQEYKEAAKTGSEAFGSIGEKLKANVEQQEQLRAGLGNLNATLEESGSIGKQITDTISEGFKDARKQLTLMVTGYIGVQAIFSGLKQGVGLAAELSDQATSLEIEYDKAAGGVRHLVDELSKLNTRTKLVMLEEIANIAAKAGVSEDKLVGVVEAIDKIKVAFGKDFGDVENGTESLIKLINIFEGAQNVSEDSLLRTGNAIRTLANESVASVPYLTDFSTRMAGLKGISDIALPSVLGLASGFEQFGQSSEVAGTAIMKVIPAIASNVEKYAKLANMSKEAFSELINNNPAEALITLTQALVSSGQDIETISTAFADASLGAGRIGAVLGTLGAKADVFRKSINSAKQSYQDTGNITDAFAKKNENLAAKLDKISKSFADAANSKAFQYTIAAIASAISLLVGNIGILITAVTAYAAIWAVANAAMIQARIVTLASNAAFMAQYAVLTITQTVSKAYTATVLLLTGATRSAAAATTLLGTAMKLLPLGIVLTAIGVLVGAFKVFGSYVSGTTKELTEQAKQMKAVNEIGAKASLMYSKQIAEINSWVSVIKSAITSADTKAKAVAELTKIDKEFGSVISNNVIDLHKLDDAYKKVTESIIKQANAQASADLAAQKQQKVINITATRQLLETTLGQGKNFAAQTGGKSDVPKEYLDILQKTSGIKSTRLIDMSKMIIVDKENREKVLQALKDQEEAAQNEFILYSKQQEQYQTTLNNMLKGDAATASKFEVDIKALGNDIERLNKEINEFQGSQKDLNAKIAERDKFQAKLDALLNKSKPITTNRGSRLTGEQRDAVKDIDAERDQQIAELKKQYLSLEMTESDYLQRVYNLNVDAANKKLELLKGTNAEERKQIAELYLYQLEQQQQKDKALFDLEKKALDRQLEEYQRGLQRQFDLVNDDPTATEQDKRKAKETQLTAEFLLQREYYAQLLNLTKRYHQNSEEEERRYSKTVEDIIREMNNLERQITVGTLEEIDTATADAIVAIKLKYDKLRKEILDSNKSAQDKGAALGVLGRAENIEIGTATLKGANAALAVAEKLRDLGLITAQQYQEIYAKAVQGQLNLNDAMLQGKKNITDLAGAVREGLSQLFGFEEGSGKAQLLADTLTAVYSNARDAMNNFYDAEAARIQQSNELTKRKLDIQLEQAKSAAQSQAEQDSLERQFAAKKAAEDKKAFEKNKKLQLQQAKINLAMQLSNLAVIAFAPNPQNILTLGIAGTIMYAVQAAAALVNYFSNVARINSATYAKGGYTGPGTGSPDHTGKKVAGVVHQNEWVGPEWMTQHPTYGAVIQELERIRSKGFAQGGYTSGSLAPAMRSSTLRPPSNPSSFLNSSGATPDMSGLFNAIAQVSEDVREVSRQTNNRIDNIKVQVVSREVEESNSELKKAKAVGTI